MHEFAASVSGLWPAAVVAADGSVLADGALEQIGYGVEPEGCESDG